MTQSIKHSPDVVPQDTIGAPKGKQKSTKTKAPRVIKPEKILENTIKDVFFSTTARRQPYLYRGFPTDDALYLVGNSADGLGEPRKNQLLFGNANQSIGIIQIVDIPTKAIVDGWLSTLRVKSHVLMFISLVGAASICAKVKWDLSKLTIDDSNPAALFAVYELDGKEERVQYGWAMQSVFSLNHLIANFEHHQKMFDYAVPVLSKMIVASDPNGNVERIHVSEREIEQSQLKEFGSHIDLILTRGVDFFDVRPLEKVSPVQPFTQVLLLSMPDGNSIYYASVLTTPKYRQLISRCNVYLIPCKYKAESKYVGT